MNRATLWTAALALTGVSSAVAQTPAAPPTAKAIEVGAVAPDFELSGATRYGVLSAPIHLSDFKGKTVILAFFPKARTQGCTIQLRNYRDKYNEVFNTGQNTVLIAISADPAQDLASWAKDDQFPFLLASDKDLKTATAYGALSSRAGMTNRNLFVVGPDGKVVFRATPFREVDPTSYTELAGVIKKNLPQASSNDR
jgi:thioredoxin-dependent peroxiredoxin